MSHTESQARELWCPMVRIARRELIQPHAPDTAYNNTVVAGCNTDALGRSRVPPSCRCIASECAMWRWVPSTTMHKEIEIRERAVAQLIGPPAYQKYEATIDVPDAPTHGYCGLAGRQEVAA